MSDASGGMGYHYGKVANIDANARLLEPEILMYEPQSDGSLRFRRHRVRRAPERVGDSAFALRARLPPQRGLPALGAARVYKDNPSGMFTDWNPTVSCAAAR